MAAVNVVTSTVSLTKENVKKIKKLQIKEIEKDRTCSFSKALNMLLDKIQ